MNAALNSSAADLKMAPICQELFSFCDIVLESLFFSLNHEKRTVQEEKEPSVALHATVFSDPDPVEPYIYALLDPGDGFIIMNYVSGYLLIFQ
jgi:hypothetical protein